jgi:hypothetical protein
MSTQKYFLMILTCITLSITPSLNNPGNTNERGIGNARRANTGMLGLLSGDADEVSVRERSVLPLCHLVTKRLETVQLRIDITCTLRSPTARLASVNSNILLSS